MIKAVLIDIDNTLLDFDEYVKETMKEGFAEFGLTAYEEYMYEVFVKINYEMWRQIERNELTYDELLKTRWNRIFSELNISFDGCRFEEYFKSRLFESAIHIEGAVDILGYLKERYIVCAASNGPYDQQINRLKKAKMLPCFSKLFISEKIGASKPSESFFMHCLHELNSVAKSEEKIQPHEIIMIGDSLTSDIAGAASAGLKTCFFDRNRSGETNGLHIDCVINKLEEIRSIL